MDISRTDYSEQLFEYWSMLSPQWSADAKGNYYHNIFEKLTSSANGIYTNNIRLIHHCEACQDFVKRTVGLGE